METTQMSINGKVNELYHNPLPTHSHPFLVVYCSTYIKH